MRAALNEDIFLYVQRFMSVSDTAKLSLLSRRSYDILLGSLYRRIVVRTIQEFEALGAALESRQAAGPTVHALSVTFRNWNETERTTLARVLGAMLRRTIHVRELRLPGGLLQDVFDSDTASGIIYLPQAWKLVVAQTFSPCVALAAAMPSLERLHIPGHAGGSGLTGLQPLTLQAPLDMLWPGLRELVVTDMMPNNVLSPTNRVEYLEVEFSPQSPVRFRHTIQPELGTSNLLTHLVILSEQQPGHFIQDFFDLFPMLRVFETHLRVVVLHDYEIEKYIKFWRVLSNVPSLRSVLVTYSFVGTRYGPSNSMSAFMEDCIAHMPALSVDLLSISAVDCEESMSWYTEPTCLYWRSSSSTWEKTIPSMPQMQPIDLDSYEHHAVEHGYYWSSRRPQHPRTGPW